MKDHTQNRPRALLDFNSIRPYRLEGNGESASERVHRVIEGEDPGWLDKWEHVLWKSTKVVTGPSTIRVDFGDPFDPFDTNTEEVAFVWDRERLAAPKVTIEEGTTVVFELPDAVGETLELWATDGVPVSVEIRALAEADQVKEEVKQERREKQAEEKETGFFGAFEDWTGTIKTVAVAAAVVVAVGGAVYFYNKAGT